MDEQSEQAGSGATDGRAISRRQLVHKLGTATVAGAGAVVAGAVIGAPAASAAAGGNLILGGSTATNDAQGSNTDVTSTSNNWTLGGFNTGGGIGVAGFTTSDSVEGVYGQNSGAGNGVRGISGSGIGVAGFGTSAVVAGTYGQNTNTGPGVEGVSTSGAGVSGNGGSYGVYGIASAGDGVYGTVSGSGSGVHGTSSGSGAGVLASHTGQGPALRVEGPASFSRSGAATVPSGKNSVTVTGIPVGPTSFALATLQRHVAGNAVAAAVPDPASSSLTIFLTNTTKSDVTVGWFVIG